MTQEQFSKYSFLLDRTARKVKQYAQQKFNQMDYDITVDQWLVIKNLAENELAHFMHVRAVFLNPVITGDAAVEITMIDVTADFLRADEADFHLGIVHVGNVGPVADGNVPARLGHLLNGCFLQTALGQPKS